VSGAGDTTIQGFATDVSYNPGDTVHFKIDTPSTAYHLDVYRLGYYQGNGARLVAANVLPSVQLPQSQPNCLFGSTTELVDCGDWAESATWTVPTTATSGVYLVHLVRDDVRSQGSHIKFVVRNDASHSALLVQTSDTTWAAYNNYGGYSLYEPSQTSRANKVSLNRPDVSRAANSGYGMFFTDEYPMIRWLEAYGYDLSYTSGVDSDRRGALITQHKIFVSMGHDEYWSPNQRANVAAARDAGINLAFFSGNEVFWKTRWENSIDGSNTPYRTLVTYKETLNGAPLDPLDPPTWTGTWRDSRFSPPADGGRPENAFTGTIFMVNCCRLDSLVVPATDSKLRFWRNTSVANLAPGTSASLGTGVLGYEWDQDANNGLRPAGLIDLSSSTYNTTSELQDFGATYGNGVATQKLTLYRATSGSLVFGAGTVQWSWGLDTNHDLYDGTSSTSPDMQQATVNVLADMGAQPATLQPGLVPATPTTDLLPPTSHISTPAVGANVLVGGPVTIAGTATDAGGGVVAGVEVSIDGGTTWHSATGGASWTYTWSPSALGPATIESRATDDSGNIESPSSMSVNVVARSCPCSIWSPPAPTPNIADSADTQAANLGVQFKVDVPGSITGVRFYKGPTNTGTHVGDLWSATGTLLATAKFTSETASGWQQVNFASPVAVTSGTYTVSYHATAGGYSYDDWYFATPGVNNPLRYFGTSTYDNPPLHALAGTYLYGSTSGFPTNSFNFRNYWVDALFTPSSAAPAVVSTSPSSGATNVSVSTKVTATFNEAVQPATISFVLSGPNGSAVPATTSYDSTTNTATLTPTASLASSTVYRATVSGALDTNGNPMTAPAAWSFTTANAPGVCPCTIWTSTTTPTVPDNTGDSSALELGVKFQSDTNGYISGIRFYKGTGNTGTHVGDLWSANGTLLATATFGGETPSGWQQVDFGTPVAINAGTTYVASYHTNVGNYSYDDQYFATSNFDNPPLHALASGASGGNGVYLYGSTSAFPTGSYNARNYWVDVVFTTAQAIPPSAPQNLTATGGNTSVTLSWQAPTSNGGAAITSYNIYRSTTSGSEVLVATGVSGLSYTDRGLTNGTTYFYEVAAVNSAGVGALSNEASATPKRKK
jgi:methionine-rich copper-binding protein CopC